MTHPLLQPGRIGPLHLRNRVIKTATNEGMSPGGIPTPALAEHHRAMARAGVGMTTVAYGAVAPTGRTFADQLLVDRRAVAGLRALTDAVHAEGAAASIQLAHCGGFSKLQGAKAPGGPSAGFNPYGLAYGVPRIRELSEADLDEVVGAYGVATMIAKECGFDAVEIHMGHGYLISQFLSPLFNRRTDDYGGELDDRLRLAIRVLYRVLDVAGGDLAVLAKVNLTDGVAGGLTEDEGLDVARILAWEGVHGLVPSGGLVQRNAFFLLRGDVPVREMAAAESSPLQRVALRAFAPFLIRPTPFTEAFFLELADRVRQEVDVPVALLGGLSSADALDRAVDAGFEWVALGRALLADPDFLSRLAAGERVVSRCTHCNRCVAEMDRAGVRCVL